MKVIIFKLVVCIILLTLSLPTVRIFAQVPQLVIQEGHPENVTLLPGLIVSRDKRYVLTYDYSGQHRLWDLASGKLLRNFQAPGKNAQSIFAKGMEESYIGGPSISPDHKFIITESCDEQMRYLLWETNTGKIVREFSKDVFGNPVKYTSADIVNDKIVVTHGHDPKFNAYVVGLVDLESGRTKEFFYHHPEIKRTDKYKDYPVYTYRCGPFAVTNDNKSGMVAMGTSEGKVYVFDTRKLKIGSAEILEPIAEYKLGGWRLRHLNFSADGKYLIASDPIETKVWDLKTEKTIQEYTYPYIDLTAMSTRLYEGYASSNGGCVVIPDTLKRVLNIFETVTGKLITSISDSENRQNHLYKNLSEFLPQQITDDGKLLFDYNEENQTIEISDLINRKPLPSIKMSYRYNLTTSAYDKKTKEVFIGKTFNDAFIINLKTGRIDNLRKTNYTNELIKNHHWEVRNSTYYFNDNVKLSADGHYIMTFDLFPRGSAPAMADIWERNGGSVVTSWSEGLDYPQTLSDVFKYKNGSAWAPKFKDVLNGIQLETECKTDPKNPVSFLSDIKLTDVKTNKSRLIYPSGITKLHADSTGYTRIEKAVFNKDGKMIYVGMRGSSILIYNTLSGKLLRKIDFRNDPTQLAGPLNSYELTTVAAGEKNEVYAGYHGVGDGVLVKFDAGSGNVLQTYGYHQGSIKSISVLDKGRLLLTVSEDKTAKFWEEGTGKLLATMIVSGKDYLIYDENGYYTSSKNGIEMVHYTMGSNIYLAQQFDLKYNRPDIIWGKLGTLDPIYLQSFKEAYDKRVSRENFKFTSALTYQHLSAPQVHIINSADNDFQDDKVTVKYNCTDLSNPVSRIKIWLNGVPVKDFDDPAVSKPKKRIDGEVNLSLLPKKNIIEIAAVNTAGIESLHEILELNCVKPFSKPDLYLISIGVGQYKNLDKLQYTVKDAKDIYSGFKKSSVFGHIFCDTVFDDQFSKSSIDKFSADIRNAKPSDYVIFFYSGHGLKNANGDYYLSCVSTKKGSPETDGVAITRFTDLAARTLSVNKLFLIDACFSGEQDSHPTLSKYKTVADNHEKGTGGMEIVDGQVDAFDLMKDSFEDLSDNSFGATIIAATRGYSKADENSFLKNGLFTYYFVKGLNSRDADYDGDHQITLSEIRRYVEENVAKMSGNKQRPVARSENGLNDFVLSGY